MADDIQLPPRGGTAGYSLVAAQAGSQPGRTVLAAVLLIAAGAILGLLGGVIWAAAAPRVVYQVATLSPPTAYATNPETSAFIAADGTYTIIAVVGGALLGLAGYLFGVRRYGPVPMLGVVLGAVAAAFLVQWAGPVLTGQDSFNNQLATSRPGALLRAPIALGAHGALAFWPVAAALVAGGLEAVGVMRARQVGSGQSGSTGRMPFVWARFSGRGADRAGYPGQVRSSGLAGSSGQAGYVGQPAPRDGHDNAAGGEPQGPSNPGPPRG